MQRAMLHISLCGISLFAFACGTASSSSQDGGSDMTTNESTCTLTANTTPTSVQSTDGCYLLSRDTTSCQAERTAQGLSGYWLKFSCRVTLSKSGNLIQAKSDNRPDYKSFYFPTSDPCYQDQAHALHNPNSIKAQSLTVSFPVTPDMTSQQMRGAIVGLSLNGVGIFGDFAAPGDDIFQEAMTFDSCGAHPQGDGVYHYHGEPYSISNNDSNFIGVMRDGYPVYGRKDADGSSPTLDTYGGHSSVTADSPTTAVYHYHLNLQTSTSGQTAGQKQWFLTTGTYRGTPATCTNC